jgi:hypothetical protein
VTNERQVRARQAEMLKEGTLRLRAQAEKYLAEAESAGKPKEANKWGAELRKINKLIADYGLDRPG